MGPGALLLQSFTAAAMAKAGCGSCTFCLEDDIGDAATQDGSMPLPPVHVHRLRASVHSAQAKTMHDLYDLFSSSMDEAGQARGRARLAALSRPVACR